MPQLPQVRQQYLSKYVREAADFVNLYSRWRGQNRWIALVKVFELVAERPEVLARGVEVPRGDKIKAFIASGFPLSDAGLRAYIANGHPDEELWRGLLWSNSVNETIAATVHGVPPFPFVRESLQKMQTRLI